MMKLQKIGSLLLVLALVLTVSAAFATSPTSLSGGEAGGYTSPDTQTVDDKVVSIQKEITVFNPDEALIYGPAITYTYTVTPGTEVSVTDATTDHSSGTAVSTTTIPGIITGVKVNGGTAGTSESATGTLAWTNADILDASASGTANCKAFTVDFSDVVFTQPGVYRYLITETANAYTTSGVTETTGTHTRYLDVYVMRSDTYDATEITKEDWRIYGYVCVIESEEITPDGDTTTTGAVKTNGFVAATNDSAVVKADEYHTYNLTIGKTLVGDATMSGHKFPFDAAWTAGAATGNFQFAVEESNAAVTKTAQAATTSVGGTDVAANTLYKVGDADAVGTADKDGSPSIANGGTVKYIGIPTGSTVAVTETNNVTGTTYATTAKDGETDVTLTGNGATISTDGKTATMPQGATATYTQTEAPAADTNAAIQFTNTLSIISPTGYVVRFAPYALMLIGGIALLIVAKKHRKHTEEDK